METEFFDDPDEAPVTEQTFDRIQESLRALYGDPKIPKEVRRRILEAPVRARGLGSPRLSAPPGPRQSISAELLDVRSHFGRGRIGVIDALDAIESVLPAYAMSFSMIFPETSVRRKSRP